MFAEVTSANVVGYGQAALNERFTGIGPMFFTIGEDVTSIQNLQVMGVDQVMGEYYIAPITSSANIPVKYYLWKGCGEYGVPDGWYTIGTMEEMMEAIGAGTVSEYLATIGMAKSEGLVTFMSGASGRALQGSGEVLADDATIPLRDRFTGIANPFPMDVNIQSYEILGADQVMGEYYVAPISSSANIPVKYYLWKGCGEYGVPDGWYSIGTMEEMMEAIGAGTVATFLVDYTFTQGQAAVAFMSGSSGRSLKIKSPIVK